MVDFVTKKEFNSRLLVEGGFGLVVFIVAGISILLVSNDITRRAAATQEYKKEFKSAVDASLVLASLKSDFERAKPYVSVLENILPIRDQLISFPKDITFIAQINNLEASVSFGAETLATQNVPGFVKFNMIIEGQYNDLLKFMQEVERGKYIIDWSDVDFIFGNKQYKGTILGRVFFQ